MEMGLLDDGVEGKKRPWNQIGCGYIGNNAVVDAWIRLPFLDVECGWRIVGVVRAGRWLCDCGGGWRWSFAWEPFRHGARLSAVCSLQQSAAMSAIRRRLRA
eukprot:scaffold98375_cov53-Cyclotella_meneghiniana.AAC.3